MGLADLHRIDVAYESDGGTALVMVAASWEPEALRLVQLQAKTVAMQSYGAGRGEPFRIELMYAETPPEAAVSYVTAMGGVVRSVQATANPGDEAGGTTRPGRFACPDGVLDLDALQAANAAAFASEYGLDGSVESLHTVDELIQARRAEEGYGPEDEAPDLDDGNLVVLAGAYCGEVLRGILGGTWHPPAVHGRALPFVRVGNSAVTAGVCGKASKALRNGTSDSLHQLAQVVLHVVRAG